ncbi:hypothetical protein EDB19DRAFT_1701131 [Suillus lakei]|nr:hypothetical protein EDB19DRAFT_1701131 [Suillus lakei]
MFRWYRGSALIIVYLFDVSNSTLDALMKSLWFTRGWALQELLAPHAILFYRQVWTLSALEESQKSGEVGPITQIQNPCRVLDGAQPILWSRPLFSDEYLASSANFKY